MSLLSDRQKLEFKRTGFLPIPDAVDADLIEEAYDLIWESIPAEREDPASYVGGEGHLSAWEQIPEERRDLFAEINEQVYAYAEAMAGEVLEPPGDRVQLALRFPEDQQTLERFEAPSAGHIDGYGPGFNEDGTVHGFSIGAAVYYDRVEPRGGGFTVWPGSHYTVAEYYASHVMETPGHAHHDGVPADLGAPFEISGDAGTAILWHNKLVHRGGENRSRNPRFASIHRFRRTDFDEIQRDAADKPWKYWPGLEGLTPDQVYPEVVEFVQREYGNDE